MKNFFTTAVLVLLTTTPARAQGIDHLSRGEGYCSFALGAGSVSANSGAVEHFGGGAEYIYKGVGIGGELGYAHWGRGAWGKAWVPSVDLSRHVLGDKTPTKIEPFVLIGVSAYIPTEPGARGAPAVNFGGGVNFWLRKHTALRAEFRDYVALSPQLDPGRNYASFRIGLTFR